MKRLWLGFALALSLLIPGAPVRADDNADRLGAFQAALERARVEIGFPGATAAYVLPDGSSGMVAVGVSDRASGEPLDPQALMMSGSTGKTYAAATALALSREGRLDLDAPITTYLGKPAWLTGLANGERITTRQLLTHSSGLRDHVDMPAFGQALIQLAFADPDKALTPLQCIAFLDGQEALFEPGKGFGYSDTGYLIAGLVIEAVAKRPYYAVVRDLFLDPLGLTLTIPADHRHIPGLAQAYPVWPEGAALPETILVAPGMMRWNPASEWTGGGFATNAHDAARWAASLYSGKAMRGAYLTELLRSVPVRTGSQKRYGLGVFIDTSAAYGQFYGHSGYYPGYRSDLAYFPKLKIAVAFQINTEKDVRSSKVLDRLREKLIAALLRKPSGAGKAPESGLP